jgi:hypothetical protein
VTIEPILEIDLLAPTQIDKVPAMNDAITALVQAEEDHLPVDMSGGHVTLTSPLQYQRYKVFLCSGHVAHQNLVVPLKKRLFHVRNASGTYNTVVGGVTGATVTVAPGDTAEILNDGTDCYLSVQGAQGPSGDVGGITIAYTFSTTTANADPGAGLLRLNNATQGSATAIYADLLSSDGSDYTDLLDNLDAAASTEKGIVRLFAAADPTKWIVFSLTSRTTQSGYREFAVTYIAKSGVDPFGNGDAICFTFCRTGDAATGVTNVWSAAQRSTEETLTYSATVTPDMDASNNFVLTLTGDCTIANPSNMPGAGETQSGQIVVIQDGTGGHTITSWGSKWYFGGGAAVPPSSDAAAITVYSYHCRGSSYVLMSPGLDFQTT